MFALDFRFFFAYAGKRERGPAMSKTDETGETTLSPARPWQLPAHGLAVFQGPGNVARLSHYFLPRLLMQGKRVLFLDGANSADPRLIARFARERRVPFAQFNRQIEIARAFTCFQLTELIARVPQFLEDFPAAALIVTAFPDLYYDEDVRDWDARVAFEQGLANLRRWVSLPLSVAVFSSAETFAPPAARRRFFERVRTTATEVWTFRAGDDQRLGLTCEPGRPRLRCSAGPAKAGPIWR
jgi:hypothetical protein